MLFCFYFSSYIINTYINSWLDNSYIQVFQSLSLSLIYYISIFLVAIPTAGSCSDLSLALLMDEVAVKTNKWQMIALHLDIDQVLIERFDQQTRGNIEQCFQKVFSKWQKQQTPSFTWQVIISVLESSSVAEHTLADQLKRKYL